MNQLNPGGNFKMELTTLMNPIPTAPHLIGARYYHLSRKEHYPRKSEPLTSELEDLFKNAEKYVRENGLEDYYHDSLE